MKPNTCYCLSVLRQSVISKSTFLTFISHLEGELMTAGVLIRLNLFNGSANPDELGWEPDDAPFFYGGRVIGQATALGIIPEAFSREFIPELIAICHSAFRSGIWTYGFNVGVTESGKPGCSGWPEDDFTYSPTFYNYVTWIEFLREQDCL
ncbi:hypothetical protein J1782_00580 [Rahnella sp. BCC 1045]|uniref:hypothetical protein n=1 Tax=Rahnella sp. BCC 1045 TaxID=2816251 RepID=UPI001C259A08|nr:hypothetical protein [Rahnella sp. BCC 1045]MBU9818389.1 hypothetical protein [Rahnella sp. BCC 1045]